LKEVAYTSQPTRQMGEVSQCFQSKKSHSKAVTKHTGASSWYQSIDASCWSCS